MIVAVHGRREQAVVTAAREHFELLDGLRGVAALFVVVMHAGDGLGLVYYPRHAYLAVPFFFTLSGFVIAHAYENGLMRRGRGGAFLLVRIERLYPMLVAGLVIGVVAAVLRGVFGHRGEPGALPLLVATGLAMVPIGQPPLPAFPLVPPQWSLALELYGNLAHLALRRWLTSRVVALALVPLFAATAWGAVQDGGLNVGWSLPQLPVAAAMFGFCYGAGILLYRWRDRPVLARWRWPMGMVVAMLVATLAVPQPLHTGGNALRDLACVLAYPPLIAAAMRVRLGSRASAIADRLGRLSYPLYISHYPLIAAACLLALRVHTGRLALYLALPVITVAAVAVAWALLVRYDEPLRRRLKALRRRDPSAGPA